MDDVDTDRIIPARFLKSITFEGLGEHVFADDRMGARHAGIVHPFDDPSRAGARVLLAGSNFGCGSSREHAPRALAQWGIRAIVARSFGEIFFSNALAIGLPCVAVSDEDLSVLQQRAGQAQADEVTVDLTARTVSVASFSAATMLPDGARTALLAGHWDGLAVLLADDGDVTRTASRLPYLTGF